MNSFSRPPQFRPQLVTPLPRPISGASFGGSSKGSGGDESPNTLRSHQTARIVDLLSEGPIVGPWSGVKSIYYDGVPIRPTNAPGNGSEDNFENYTIAGVSGFGNQPVIKGFASQQSEFGVNTQLTHGNPITKRLSSNDLDRVRITVSTPALMYTQTDGDIIGNEVDFIVRLNSNGGGWKTITTNMIDGKTNTNYQRELIFALTGSPPWDIQVERLEPDSTDVKSQKDLYWDSYTEILDARINYTLSAVLCHTVRAEDFDHIPDRVVDCGGLLVRYPSNYNPTTRKYTGTWDGTFVTGYCNNPAWVFYDIIVESRYGIGDFIDPADVDKWELYAIAKWCDGNVPDGKGGQEPRWTFNGVIRDRQEAYDLLANIASVWRGSAFWAGGQLVPICDMPSDPVFQFSNANVIDGQFNYQSEDIRARHNQVMVAWNDPANLGERRLVPVEDRASIAKYGILKTEIVAMGCTSEGQAQRVGEWLMYTENYEGETVTFTAGIEGAYVRPGAICQISDVTVAGARRSGRLVEVTADYIRLDSEVTLRSGFNYSVTCIRSNGNLVTLRCGSPQSPTDRLNLQTAWNGPWADKDTIWVLSSDDLEPSIWRVVSSKPTGEKDRYEILAISHNKSKWGYVERDKKLDIPDISNIGGVPIVTSIKVEEFIYQLSPTTLGNRLLVSWQSKAPYFDVYYREKNGQWTRLFAISQKSIEFDVSEKTYEVWITPRNSIGRRGSTAKEVYTVVGRKTPPKKPQNFRIQVIEGVALFQWLVATEIDVLVGGSYELRYSPRTVSAVWTSANRVIASIPGTATTVEIPYRPGTYFLRVRDIGGLASEPVMIIATQPNKSLHTFVHLVEQPLYEGQRTNVEIKNPQKWLIISDPYDEGFYKFKNQVNLGGVFSVKLTIDLFAFPYIEGQGFIDDRMNKCDTWQSWDDEGTDGAGAVTIQYRQTNTDPAGTPDWTEWQQFIAGEYEGWAFQFRAWLQAPQGQNVGIEELGVIADISDKQDIGNDIAWAPNVMNITYSVKFFSIPSVAINIQNAQTGDYYEITNKTKTGFTLRLRNAAGSIITGSRTFDWIAIGY